MAGSTYSSNLKIELMTTGENSGTWGDVTNTNLGTALEQAVVGYGNPDYVSDANLTISITNSNAAQAARALVLNVTSVFGSLTQTRELVVPTIQKQYIVQNNTTGGQSITVKTSAGTGITVPNGRKAHLYVDGTNVIQMFDFVDINGGTIDGATVGASSASSGAFTTLTASGATTLNGAVTLGDAAGDNITFNGTVTSHLLFTDNTYDIGASGATRPRNLYLAGAATIGGNLSVGGTLTLTGGVNLNGNVTVGDSSSDTLTINSTITSNLLFTDNTYDIGASGATRPRNLFLAGNATIGGNQTLTGTLTVDSTTDSSSTTTGSIQTDGGVGIAKNLFVGNDITRSSSNSGAGNYIKIINTNTAANSSAFLTIQTGGTGAGSSTVEHYNGTTALYAGAYSSFAQYFIGPDASGATPWMNVSGSRMYVPSGIAIGTNTALRTNNRINLGNSTGQALVTYDDGTANPPIQGIGPDLTGGNYEMGFFSGGPTGAGTVGKFTWSRYNSTTATYTRTMLLDPDANLTVGGSSFATASVILNAANGTAQGAGLSLQNAGVTKTTLGNRAWTIGSGTDTSGMLQAHSESLYYNVVDTTKSHYFQFNSSNAFVITNSGATLTNGLGLGGASSNSTLLLNGSLNSNTQNGYKFANSSSGTGATATLFLNANSADLQLGVTSSGWTLDPLTSANQAYWYSNAANGINIYTSTGAASPVIITTNGYQRVYVSGDTGTLAGTKVGIGNSTPLGLLDLGILASTPKFFWYGSSSANQAYVAGVGLNLGSASNSTSFFVGYGSGAGSTNFEWLRGNSAGNAYPWTSYTQLMTLSSNGTLTVVNNINSSAAIQAGSTFNIANVGGDITGSGGSTNYIGIRDSGGTFRFATHTSGTYSGRTGFGTSCAQPQAILDLGSNYGANGAKALFYNDNNSGELNGTKVGIYMDRFSESNSVTMVFPTASGTAGRFHFANKETGGTTITDICYVQAGSTSWTFPSDARLKDVECDVTGALDGIDQIRPVFYVSKRDPNKKRKIGTLAQDWLKVLPEVVDVPEVEFDFENAVGNLALANSDTTAYLLAALKELKAEFRAYKASHP